MNNGHKKKAVVGSRNNFKMSKKSNYGKSQSNLKNSIEKRALDVLNNHNKHRLNIQNNKTKIRNSSKKRSNSRVKSN